MNICNPIGIYIGQEGWLWTADISEIDGTRLGYVDDIIVDTKSSAVVAFVIFARIFFFGIFGKSEDYIIPWEKIKLIGEDTIIISCKTPKPEKRPKKRLFFGKN